MKERVVFCKICGNGPIAPNRFICQKISCAQVWAARYDTSKQESGVEI